MTHALVVFCLVAIATFLAIILVVSLLNSICYMKQTGGESPWFCPDEVTTR